MNERSPGLQGSAPQSANATKVQGWVDGLTLQQEIHCDYYPQADNSDPISPSWALIDLDKRRCLDFIDQNAPGPDNHSEISDLLGREEVAGRIVGIACGFYRHPARAAADQAKNDLEHRFLAARGEAAEPLINQLAALAIDLHAIYPAMSVGEHRAALGRYVDGFLQAWGDDASGEHVPFADDEDVPF